MKPPLRIDENELADLVDSEDSIIIEGEHLSGSEARYIVAAVNACHAAQLTREQLDAGVIERLVEAAKELYEGYETLCQSWDEWCGSVDCPRCGRRAKKLQQVESALAPFRKGSNV